MRNDYSFLPHEFEHLDFLRENAHECTLFLKRDDDSFPLEKPASICLIGNGVRHTVIGGIGSGAVNVSYQENIEEAFTNAGFEVMTKDWLDKYDESRKQNIKSFIKRIKKEARAEHMIAATYSIGRVAPEFEYEYPVFGDHEVAIYVLSRNAGEGADRQLIKGDVYLTDTEIRDILLLNKTYQKFMLVLNTPSVIDLTPVMEVRNILLVSQLGSMTGDILAQILLGKLNPSGKLTDTWAHIKDYPYIDTPIENDDCLYKEGVYVGYRYFESKKIEPVFPIGFGLSYTSFEYKFLEHTTSKDKITLKVNVTNKGKFPGKEVIQAYMSGPSPRPALELVSFKKTKLLNPKESEVVELSFKLSDFPTYDENKKAYVLNKGRYLIKAGNSSKNLKPVLNIQLNEDVVTKEVKNVFKKPEFEDLVIERKEEISNAPSIELKQEDFTTTIVEYVDKYKIETPEFIKNLSIDELILMCLGDYKTGFQGIIGQSCSLVLGGAGETSLRVEGLDKAVSMVDGPAGLRLVREYVVNHNGAFPTSSESIWEYLKDYLPKPLPFFMSYERNLNKKGSKVIQIATAIPIATALAQSFNPDFISDCGRLVKREMEIYGVDVWLAPGVNIHRHILCGRNFEYYSEDPLISAVAASAMISAVQEDKSKATTIKHFVCNNQETNRLNNNSIVSEKAIREIYLPSFEKAIRWSNPRSIMTSYNLVNGYHTSEHKGLITDILRSEWGYKGLIMTDWVASGQSYRKGNKNACDFASKNIKAGNNICMPGSRADIRDIKKALKNSSLNREDLEISASIVYDFIQSLKQE